MKVLVADKISSKGVAWLKKQPGLEVIEAYGSSPAKLLELVKDVHAIAVRSETKITAEVLAAAPLLKVVGRAGVGVDNVDVDAATERGVIVMNTPSGNTIATAELTFTHLLCGARPVPQAAASMRAGQWDRKTFSGIELFKKTLGIVGLGRIGGEVARRAQAFGMRVLAFDPYLAPSRAKAMQIESVPDGRAPRPVGLHHGPHAADRRHPLHDRRGGLRQVQEGGADLQLRARRHHQGGGPRRRPEVGPGGGRRPRRLRGGAPGRDERAAQAAQRDPDAAPGRLDGRGPGRRRRRGGRADRRRPGGGVIRNAVNMPTLDAATLAVLGPYLDLGSKLGTLVQQISPEQVGSLKITYWGKVVDLDANAITRAVLRGWLRRISGDSVNFVNAPFLLERLGVRYEVVKSTGEADYTELIQVEALAADGVVERGRHPDRQGQQPADRLHQRARGRGRGDGQAPHHREQRRAGHDRLRRHAPRARTRSTSPTCRSAARSPGRPRSWSSTWTASRATPRAAS
jgi:D-3-phosphoglycerate dehydrogenase